VCKYLLTKIKRMSLTASISIRVPKIITVEDFIHRRLPKEVVFSLMAPGPAAHYLTTKCGRKIAMVEQNLFLINCSTVLQVELFGQSLPKLYSDKDVEEIFNHLLNVLKKAIKH
jgi:hypothetical protein